MSLWAILPVKPLRRGKSRLAGVLSDDERALLNHSMLGNTLKILKSVPEIEQVLVVSRDPAALVLAREHEARTVKEDGNPELNAAIKRATVAAQMYHARSVLVIPADLPLISADDIREFVSHSGHSPEIVISPDRRSDGTNALLINPAGLIEYHYGPGSFENHIQQAKKYNARIEICALPSLLLDLDLPEDLELLREMEHAQLGI